MASASTTSLTLDQQRGRRIEHGNRHGSGEDRGNEWGEGEECSKGVSGVSDWGFLGVLVGRMIVGDANGKGGCFGSRGSG